MRVTILTALAVILMALPIQAAGDDHTWGGDPDKRQTSTQISPCDCEKTGTVSAVSQQLPKGDVDPVYSESFGSPPDYGAWVSWLTYLMCYAVAWDESCPNGSHITIEF